MQWFSSPNAGFCPVNVAPWLPAATDLDCCNVADQDKAPGSMLVLFRNLVALHRTCNALNRGDYRTFDVGGGPVFAFGFWNQRGP